jgi:hypothetical protein
MASLTALRNQNGAMPTTNSTGEGGKKSKSQATGQKLMIRHLPPLITEEEVQAVLGEEWKAGNGKVGWAQFQQGKVSKRYVHFPQTQIPSQAVDRNTNWLYTTAPSRNPDLPSTHCTLSKRSMSQPSKILS